MNKIKAVLKRIFTYAPKDCMIFTVLLATVITMLIPLYRLCAYTIPYCDDYDAFLYPKEALKTLPGLFGLIKGSADYSHVEYGSFQGTFTSCFMMAFNFFVFNPMLYGLGPVMLITIMAVSVFLFIYTLFKTVFVSIWILCIASILRISTGAIWGNIGTICHFVKQIARAFPCTSIRCNITVYQNIADGQV